MKTMNKKAIFFTIMTIIFLAIFVSYATIQVYYGLSDKMFSIESRVDTMDDFIDGVKKDIERGLYISSFRAMLTLQQHIIDNGVFIDDVDLRFEESLLNGSIYGKGAPFMQESTFNDWINSISAQARKININLSINVNDIKLYQSTPWKINIDANLTIGLQDFTKLASWRTNEHIQTYLNVEGFEDPLYVINFFGKATNMINRTKYDGNYTFKTTVWNVSRLLEHIDHSYYAQHNDSPSFLMRLSGNIGPSPYGIESMINLQELSYKGIKISYNQSIIDHVYFAGAPTTNYRINMTPSWVRIDSGHLNKYNVSQLIIV